MSSFQDYLKRPSKDALAARLRVLTWVLTTVVLLLVGVMRRVKISLPEGVDLMFLPPVHALLNTLVAVCLVLAIFAIKRKNINQHKLFMNTAMGLSVAFLVCYVAYHITTEETRYPEGADWRGLYFFFLITHIILAAVSLPFILMTWASGITNRFSKHKKLAKWVFPLWLYVAVTGPICYLMLRPFYP